MNKPSATQDLIILTDGSVNTQSNVGYGAFLSTFQPECLPTDLSAQVKVKRFEQTSSTKLELQTLLWAFNEIRIENTKLIIYTDSQNIIGLPERRARLEQNDYRSAKGRLLNNAALYQEFFRRIDFLDCEFIKVRGHLAAKEKNSIDRLFTLVDRASRKALREDDIHPDLRTKDD